MSRLKIYNHKNSTHPEIDVADGSQIIQLLAKAGIRFERWQANKPSSQHDRAEDIIANYKADIDRLFQEGGYQSVDVLKMTPEHQERLKIRNKFLAEHTHTEDEVRFFVEGGGIFYMHIGSNVYATFCEKGDLISVPAGIPHWFDMGLQPNFAAIRLFTNKEGWIPNHTGSAIAKVFPDYDAYKAPSAFYSDIDAIVTDIEGTTSSLSFVKDVLFPYAAAHLPDYLRIHADDLSIKKEIETIRKLENSPNLNLEDIIIILQQWIAEDRKITPLKTIQGLIWEEGYRAGAFTGHIYEDTAEAIRRWHASGKQLFVYSSGSVMAQKLLFSHTPYGDLTHYFDGYFDTACGAKVEKKSYQTIAEAIQLPAARILYFSDQIKELEAAREAGMQTVLLLRPENDPSFVWEHIVPNFQAISIEEMTYAKAV